MLGFNVQIFKALQKNITTSNMDVCYLLTWYVRVAWRIVRSLLTDFVLYWDSIFINLFNFWFLRNCKKIWQYQTLNIRNIELFTKVVTYQTTPLIFASVTLILDVWQDSEWALETDVQFTTLYLFYQYYVFLIRKNNCSF